MEKFRSTQRDKLLYYNPDQRGDNPENPWLLIPFVNQCFNLTDIRNVRVEVEYLNPYTDLEIRWLYPEPPQKLSQSIYKDTLDKVNFDLWIDTIIPKFEELTAECHCQKEFLSETRCQGHLASGNLDKLIKTSIILDRLKRGSMFRKTTNDNFQLSKQALGNSLRELFDRKRLSQAHKWIKKFLKTFEKHAQKLKDQNERGEINLKNLPCSRKDKRTPEGA
jgi:hypothetical protein